MCEGISTLPRPYTAHASSLLSALTGVLLACAPAVSVVAAFPKLELQPISQNQLLAPVAIESAGDGSNRLFIVDQRGQIHIIDAGGALLTTPFLDISGLLVTERSGFDERGLLGMAFHPDYAIASAAGEGRFYLYYSAPSPDAPGTTADPVDHMSVLAEYQVSASDPNLANPASERILFTVNEPQFNHDAGQLAFGPDGMLYIGLGDGGGADDNDAGHTGGSSSKPSGALGNAQDRTKLLGSILRIDPLGANGPGGQYGIPADNPFVAEGNGIREEIFAYGLRNPWRFSFDDGPGGTNRLICADVGQNEVEEVNLIVSGGNYGWRNKEGTFDFDATAPGTGPFIDPIAEYAHPGLDIGLPAIGRSVTGGYVYRGAEFPELVGHYVFADWSTGFGFANGTLLALDEYQPDTFSLVIPEVTGGNPIGRFISAFGEDEAGELYVATKTTLAPSATDPNTGDPTGAIWKVTVATETGPTNTIALPPMKDNSMYSEEPNNSNGSGTNLYAGRTLNFGIRRALLNFDIANAIPEGSTIQSATLTLKVTKEPTSPPTEDFSLHRLTNDWGEAGSTATGPGGKGAPAEAGDATWTHNFFNSSTWSTAGGDFLATPSATTTITSGLIDYQWSHDQVVADVQQFLDNPGSNFGWLLKADNDGSLLKSARRFASREAATNPPTLSVQYAEPAPSNLESWIDTHFAPAETVDFSADPDGDLLSTLFEYAAGLDPKSANAPSAAFTIQLDANDRLVLTFVRDPRADNLSYVVETSDDLSTWSPLCTSTNGNIPTGVGSFTDYPIPSRVPFREVRVSDITTAASTPKRFIRYRVEFTNP